MGKQYEVVILGGGIGGYTAAIRAAQLGKSVALVEKGKLGGTCLHTGCIPSKSIIHSAELFHTMQASDTYGIETAEVVVNMQKVQNRKQTIIEKLHQGVQFLMKKHKIDVFYGEGRITGASIFSPEGGAIAIEQEDGEIVTIKPKHIILATGSRARTLQGLPENSELIWSSEEALHMTSLPASIIIIGGGVIGVEWASLLNHFGVEVTIVEMSDRLLPLEDQDVSAELQKNFESRGIQVFVSATFEPNRVEIVNDKVQMAIEHAGKSISLTASNMLLAVGRQPNVQGLGLENTMIEAEERGIQVNEFMRTVEDHIYAVGDVTGLAPLAHAASHQAIIAVEHLAGMNPERFTVDRVPSSIFTTPQVASVGLTETSARERGLNVKVGKFPFRASGKAVVEGEDEGFIKVVADPLTNDILGVHIIGKNATELITEASLAMLLDATPWEVSRAIHPHPTRSEAFVDAMLAVDGSALGM